MNNSGLHRLVKQITLINYLIFLIAGCGYTTRSALSPELKTIYVAPFKNKIDITSENTRNKYRTYTPGIEVVVTNALVDRFILDGHLKVVSQENADLVISGEIVDYRKDAVRYTVDNEVEEYRVNIIVDIALTNRHSNEVLWQVKDFGGDTSTFVKGNLAKSDATVIKEASNDLVRRIVEKTVEVW